MKKVSSDEVTFLISQLMYHICSHKFEKESSLCWK